MFRKNNIKQKEKLLKHENKDNYFEETKKIIISLKIRIEEAKGIEEEMKSHPKEKEETCEKLEYEVVSLKENLKKSNTKLRFEKSIETLSEILVPKGHHSSRLVLAMMRIIILLKKILKDMIIFSKAP